MEQFYMNTKVYMGETSLEKISEFGIRRAYLVAVPTTSGTGSEVTCFSVITDPQNQTKYALRDPSLISDEAFLDPGLTTTVSAHITADTGTDKATVHGLIRQLRNLMGRIGISGQIAELGIGKDEFLNAIPEMAKKAAADVCTETNPRIPVPADFEDIYRRLWKGGLHTTSPC